MAINSKFWKVSTSIFGLQWTVQIKEIEDSKHHQFGISPIISHLQEAEPMWRVMKGAGPMCQMLHQWLIHLLVAMKLGKKQSNHRKQETVWNVTSPGCCNMFYNSHQVLQPNNDGNTMKYHHFGKLPVFATFFCKAGLLSNVDCWYYHYEDFEVTTLSLTRKDLVLTWPDSPSIMWKTLKHDSKSHPTVYLFTRAWTCRFFFRCRKKQFPSYCTPFVKICFSSSYLCWWPTETTYHISGGNLPWKTLRLESPLGQSLAQDDPNKRSQQSSGEQSVLVHYLPNWPVFNVTVCVRGSVLCMLCLWK